VEKSFELIAEAGELPSFRTKLRGLLQEAGLSEKVSGEILVAVQEALTNIVRHAYRGKREKIEILVKNEPDRIEILIRDFGIPFEPEKIPEPELPPKRPGGLGLYLMKSLMDKVDYESQGQAGNLLRLMKYKPGKEQT
jgi:serine/threonine-protein kinase RsbW